ncbi:hypothetical protein Hanom_Chr07g00607761 [Helianthus anomalus]
MKSPPQSLLPSPPHTAVLPSSVSTTAADSGGAAVEGEGCYVVKGEIWMKVLHMFLYVCVEDTSAEKEIKGLGGKNLWVSAGTFDLGFFFIKRRRRGNVQV